MTLLVRTTHFIKTHKLLTTAVAFIITLVVGMAIPMAMPDGTEKFEDAEREAAKAAVEHLENFYRGTDAVQVVGILNFHVDAVAPGKSTPSKPHPVCSNDFDSNDPNAANSYIVKVRYKTLFGVTARTSDLRVCDISSG